MWMELQTWAIIPYLNNVCLKPGMIVQASNPNIWGMETDEKFHARMELPALGRQREAGRFLRSSQASLVYLVSYRTTRAMQRKILSFLFGWFLRQFPLYIVDCPRIYSVKKPYLESSPYKKISVPGQAELYKTLSQNSVFIAYSFHCQGGPHCDIFCSPFERHLGKCLWK